MHTSTPVGLADERPGGETALATAPQRPRAWLLLAHGAGAGMRHPFMEALATALADTDIASLRYEFPYMAQGRKRPDHANVLTATVHAAIDRVLELAGELPVFAGGKSMGGRMTSMAVAARPRRAVRGLVFFGFPLHPAGKTGADRALHLRELALPLLFVQGTRDKLAPLSELEPVLAGLVAPTRLHIIAGADHGFAVPKRSGLTERDVFENIVTAVATWMHEVAVDY